MALQNFIHYSLSLKFAWLVKTDTFSLVAPLLKSSILQISNFIWLLVDICEAPFALFRLGLGRSFLVQPIIY